MNCTTAREQLPLFIYCNLDEDAAKGIESHLAECPACRAERAALTLVRTALSAAPAPPRVEIDVRRLYAELQRTAERRVRRWRWAALFIFASAAGLAILILATRMELRVEEHQLVVRWGSPPSVVEKTPTPRLESPAVALDNTDPQAARRIEDQLVVLSKIIHTMARDSANRGEDYDRDLAGLQRRLNDLQRQMDRRFLDAEKDLRTLYKWQFVRNDKGELQ